MHEISTVKLYHEWGDLPPMFMCFPLPEAPPWDCSAELIEEAFRLSTTLIPASERGDFLRGVDALIDHQRAGRSGAAIVVAWNLCQRWARICGQTNYKNGTANAREPQRRGGGRKEGSGRKAKHSQATIRGVFDETNPSLKTRGPGGRYELTGRILGMKAEAVRKRLAGPTRGKNR